MLPSFRLLLNDRIPGSHSLTRFDPPPSVAKSTKVSAGSSSPYRLLSMPWVQPDRGSDNGQNSRRFEGQQCDLFIHNQDLPHLRFPYSSPAVVSLLSFETKDECRVTSLLDFVATLKRYTSKAVEPFVVTQTLDIVYPRQTAILAEASQLLFDQALDEILTWEPGASPDKSRPSSDINITRLIASLEYNLTHELSVRFAVDTSESGIVQGL
ncbi:hypothetical protein DXG01_000667 [Tephrocybe rancida]|nr:hypothetical protein DXG01_000667 [Tephrocybe rancida]